ncbi:hypothetical protein ACFX2I_043165 [Malus domestica]
MEKELGVRTAGWIGKYDASWYWRGGASGRRAGEMQTKQRVGMDKREFVCGGGDGRTRAGIGETDGLFVLAGPVLGCFNSK